jgi:hypothetical protein
MAIRYQVSPAGEAGWVLATLDGNELRETRQFYDQAKAVAEMRRLEGTALFGLDDFDVDTAKREVRHRASGASVAFYPCSEEDWRASPSNFAMQRNVGSLDPSDTANFDAGALAAALAAGMRCH